eukprot:CAMPEP_0177773896 /NCGR_PEP_ID=MMETSP0491_2-20121128/13168_1 /TAXON_ID=63592 /ORGANISM="Tetraselmis chuii, Strain PLY429" /LENGTH=138 /DNA_ID=CAMNT_0019292139 /DNA_START=247 /DNA_END=663 /DNA_ORIENTATION=-
MTNLGDKSRWAYYCICIHIFFGAWGDSEVCCFDGGGAGVCGLHRGAAGDGRGVSSADAKRDCGSGGGGGGGARWGGAGCGGRRAGGRLHLRCPVEASNLMPPTSLYSSLSPTRLLFPAREAAAGRPGANATQHQATRV